MKMLVDKVWNEDAYGFDEMKVKTNKVWNEDANEYHMQWGCQWVR